MPVIQFFTRLPSSPGGYAETRDLEQICEGTMLPVHFRVDKNRKKCRTAWAVREVLESHRHYAVKSRYERAAVGRLVDCSHYEIIQRRFAIEKWRRNPGISGTAD